MLLLIHEKHRPHDSYHGGKPSSVNQLSRQLKHATSRQLQLVLFARITFLFFGHFLGRLLLLLLVLTLSSGRPSNRLLKNLQDFFILDLLATFDLLQI